MRTLKVFQIARELGVDSKAVIAKCKAEGVPNIDTHLSVVSPGLAATIREWFSTSSTTASVERTAHVDVEKIKKKSFSRNRATSKHASQNSSSEDSTSGVGNVTVDVAESPKESETMTDNDSAILEANKLLDYLCKTVSTEFSPAFTPLLKPFETVTKKILINRLKPLMPPPGQARGEWFIFNKENKISEINYKDYSEIGSKLKSLLIAGKGESPIGLLCQCLKIARDNYTNLNGVFYAVKKTFNVNKAGDILPLIQRVNKFRNEYVVHDSNLEITVDQNKAKEELKHWSSTLRMLWEFDGK